MRNGRNNYYGTGYQAGHFPQPAQGYNNNYNQGGHSQPPKKKSGSKKGIDKNGKPYTQGFKIFKGQGYTNYFASVYKNTTLTTSKSGIEWGTVILKITPQNAPPYIQPALMNMQTGKVICKSIGLVINPLGGPGGVVARIGVKPKR